MGSVVVVRIGRSTITEPGGGRLGPEAGVRLADGMVSLSFFRPVRRGPPIPRLGSVVTVRRSIWHEPRPADAPPIGRLDWLLVGVFAAAALVEGIVRPGLA